tara:strand:- start:103 stop:1005 length:903 start_codon:yes stop_codon:yes gene_type:complete
MRLPNFIISGFPKCGTTSLHYYLAEHPEIFMPKQKELHFFTNKILSKQIAGKGDKIALKTHVRNFKEYSKFFSTEKNYKSVGETSPSYINYPELFNEIKNTLSNPKIIVLVRDPIKRAYSNYLHLVREGREQLSFAEALAQEDKRKKLQFSDFWYYKFNSSYYEKLAKAKEIFSEVLILTQEELMLNPEETIKKTYRFLEVNSEFLPTLLNKKYNPGGSYSNNIITRTIFKPSSAKNFMKKMISVKPWMKDILNSITRKYKINSKAINKETEQELKKFFRKEVKYLEQMGVEIKQWGNYK